MAIQRPHAAAAANLCGCDQSTTDSCPHGPHPTACTTSCVLFCIAGPPTTTGPAPAAETSASFTIVYNITGPLEPVSCGTFDPRTQQWHEEPAGQHFGERCARGMSRRIAGCDHQAKQVLVRPEQLLIDPFGVAWPCADANGTEVPVSAAAAQLQTQICAQPLVWCLLPPATPALSFISWGGEIGQLREALYSVLHLLPARISASCAGNRPADGAGCAGRQPAGAGLGAGPAVSLLHRFCGHCRPGGV